jgi:hypothetical protein
MYQPEKAMTDKYYWGSWMALSNVIKSILLSSPEFFRENKKFPDIII